MSPEIVSSAAVSDLVAQRKQFLAFVRRRVDSLATAEDILQSAYTRALEQSPSLRSEESASAWFYRILRNAVIDYYRHRAVEDRALERWAKDLATETTPDPATEQIVCACITNALDAMKPAYTGVLRSIDLAGDSLETFAQNTGITANNASVRLHRARQALKKKITLICGTCCRHGCLNCTCR